MAGAGDIFGIAAAILVDALRRQLQHAVGKLGEEMAIVRDEEHGAFEIGKRLDFLIQELHREANTMGSKSAALELTRISVDMKVLIEQMREQVQNIE